MTYKKFKESYHKLTKIERNSATHAEYRKMLREEELLELLTKTRITPQERRDIIKRGMPTQTG